MENVVVKKKELLSVLNKNLKLHQRIYVRTFKMFKNNYTKKLKAMLKDIKRNKFEKYLGLDIPQNHEVDYKNAIRMAEMDCRDEIKLTNMEFSQYVLNQWTWLSSFRSSYVSNYSSYSSSCSNSSSISVSPSGCMPAEFIGYFSGCA